jgi:hypothetical protein
MLSNQAAQHRHSFIIIVNGSCSQRLELLHTIEDWQQRLHLTVLYVANKRRSRNAFSTSTRYDDYTFRFRRYTEAQLTARLLLSLVTVNPLE